MTSKAVRIALAALLAGAAAPRVAHASPASDETATVGRGLGQDLPRLAVRSDDPSLPVNTAIPRVRKPAPPQARPRPSVPPFALPTAPITVKPEPVKAVPDATPRGPEFPPYERELLRLAEILGAMHYLRGLCGAGDGDLWRAQMEGLIVAEAPRPVWRARLVDSFNSGYRGFDRTYRQCTASATQAIDLYLAEGKSLAGIIRVRYAD